MERKVEGQRVSNDREPRLKRTKRPELETGRNSVSPWTTPWCGTEVGSSLTQGLFATVRDDGGRPHREVGEGHHGCTPELLLIAALTALVVARPKLG